MRTPWGHYSRGESSQLSAVSSQLLLLPYGFDGFGASDLLVGCHQWHAFDDGRRADHAICRLSALGVSWLLLLLGLRPCWARLGVRRGLGVCVGPGRPRVRFGMRLVSEVPHGERRQLRRGPILLGRLDSRGRLSPQQPY